MVLVHLVRARTGAVLHRVGPALGRLTDAVAALMSSGRCVVGAPLRYGTAVTDLASDATGEVAAAMPAPARAPRAGRIVGLDGIRGLAAVFVVMNHIFLRAWPGYPVDRAPFWATEFIYGRFAVIVFIALSGFSLALGPARSGWRFDSVATFAHRRAWRILPPYWAALGFSLVMTWYVLAQPGWAGPDGRSVVVYGLLVQDAVPAGNPNRAFWSIAVEAQLYVLLPVLLVIVRRVSAIAMVAMVAAVVVVAGLLGPHVSLMHAVLSKGTPDLAVLFAVGVLAAGVVTASDRDRSRPWGAYALAAAVPVFALIIAKGPTWSNDHLFWVDLAWGPAIGCFLAAVATSRPRPIVRLLDTRPLRTLGSFSYSLYLTHAPIVIAVSYGLVLGRVAPGTAAFLVLTAVLLPVTVCFARLFAAVFELPFQRHRGWTPLRRAISNRLRGLVRPEPEPLPESEPLPEPEPHPEPAVIGQSWPVGRPPGESRPQPSGVRTGPTPKAARYPGDLPAKSS